MSFFPGNTGLIKVLKRYEKTPARPGEIVKKSCLYNFAGFLQIFVAKVIVLLKFRTVIYQN